MVKKRSTIPQYTYRRTSAKEEKQVYRRIAFVAAATTVILLVIYFWGLSFINLLGLLGDKKETKQTTKSGFDIPLQKPSLTPIQSPLNTEQIDISGTTSPDVTVSLSLNAAAPLEQKSGGNGSFTFSAVKLKEGLNQIQVTATKSDGTTEKVTTSVILDKSAPTLSVTSPADNTILPAETKSVTVSGTTSDPDGVVFVNSIQVTLDPKTGNFSYSLTIDPTQSQIEVKAFDLAGNSVVQTRTVTVSGSSGASP